MTMLRPYSRYLGEFHLEELRGRGKLAGSYFDEGRLERMQPETLPDQRRREVVRELRADRAATRRPVLARWLGAQLVRMGERLHVDTGSAVTAAPSYPVKSR